jgi:hypothetical protein
VHSREQTSVDVLDDLLRERTAGPDPGPGPRPRPGDRRPPRRSSPPVLVVRAIAGAGLSVCAVGLGIVALAWSAPAPERVAPLAGQVASPTPTRTPTPVLTRPPVVAAPRVAAPPVLPAPTAAPPARVPVTVLNNSRIPKLAARGASRVVAAGWPVAAVGNFRGRIPVTTVYYDPGLQAAASELAADVHGVVRVRPRFSGLPARGVVVVLTREFPL